MAVMFWFVLFRSSLSLSLSLSSLSEEEDEDEEEKEDSALSVFVDGGVRDGGGVSLGMVKKGLTCGSFISIGCS